MFIDHVAPEGGVQTLVQDRDLRPVFERNGALARSPAVCGVRQILNYEPSWPRNKRLGNLLDNRNWIEGYHVLEDFGLSFDLQLNPCQFQRAIQLVADHPRTPVIESGWKALDELKRSAEIAAIGVGINEEAMMGRFLDRWTVDFFLVAMPYTLIDQDVLHCEFPNLANRGVGIVVGAPYASGILATGPVKGAKYRYASASPEVLDKVSRIQAVCERHGVPLKAAALQFPLAHPIVACVIPGALTHEHVWENRELFDFPIPSDCWAELQFAQLIHENAPLPLGD